MIKLRCPFAPGDSVRFLHRLNGINPRVVKECHCTGCLVLLDDGKWWAVKNLVHADTFPLRQLGK